ncbi:hypothetical protein RFI_02842, partial [Reticulomyxa filosa]
SQQWKKAFAHVQLAMISKKKLLKMANKIRESENEELLNIDEIINNKSSSPANRRDSSPATSPTTTRQMYMSIYFSIHNSKLVKFNMNDDKWKGFNLRNGDEIFCTYSFDPNPNTLNSELRVDKIEFPVLYQSEVNEDDDSAFVLIQVHCKKAVLFQTTPIYRHCNTCLYYHPFVDFILNIKKNGGLETKWSSIANIMTHGLLLISKAFSELLRLVLCVFFCFGQNNSFKSTVLHLYVRRRIGDITPNATVKHKQEKAFQILNWLENPLEEKVDWNIYDDMDLSDLINQYKNQHRCSSHENENNSKLQWLKTQITLEAMNYVAKECIAEVRSIPNELVERIIQNFKCCSESSSMIGSNSSRISNAMSSLKKFIEKYHNTNEEDDLTNLQTELEHIEALPILMEQQTVDNMYWV